MVNKITKWHLILPFISSYSRNVILADMERELGFPHQTLKKYATELVNDNILIEEKKPKNLVYKLNRENRMVLNYLSSAEKLVLEKTLRGSKLLKRLYEMVSPFMADADFIIFGSFAQYSRGNDIDMLVVGSGEGVKEKITEFENTYGKDVHLLTMDSFNPGSAFTRELVDKHVIFSGFDNFIKIFWDFSWKN